MTARHQGSAAQSLGMHGERFVSNLFAKGGWSVRKNPFRSTGASAGFVIQQGEISYVVGVKAASEGRGDRLIPLWSQAWLQAARAAQPGQHPLAVVAAPRIPPRVADQVLQFAADYVPGAAAGVVDFAGLRAFRGPFLDDLNRDGPYERAMSPVPSAAPINIFSDLNQWMLKVLLAPDLPADLLAAPRGRYRNASQLAKAADVSVMSASRLVRELQRDGFLHESSKYLELVRRPELFDAWRSSAPRRVRESGFRFPLPEDPSRRLATAVNATGGCLGLFTAADALGIGFVHGVPSYVYVQPSGAEVEHAWKNLDRALPGEAPDLIIRVAGAPNSIFRGAVVREGVLVSDVLQVWLDVSSHPSRGSEQAEIIRQRVLKDVIG